MSLPTRSGTQISAMAEVRVNRGVNVNDLSPALTRLHDPLEAHRMVLRHRRSHNQDGVRILQILLCSRGAAAPKRCAQTGHGRAVSNSRLIAQAHHSQSSSKQLLDEVVFFVVESRTAQVGDGSGLHQGLAVAPFLK